MTILDDQNYSQDSSKRKHKNDTDYMKIKDQHETSMELLIKDLNLTEINKGGVIIIWGIDECIKETNNQLNNKELQPTPSKIIKTLLYIH